MSPSLAGLKFISADMFEQEAEIDNDQYSWISAKA